MNYWKYLCNFKHHSTLNKLFLDDRENQDIFLHAKSLYLAGMRQ